MGVTDLHYLKEDQGSDPLIGTLVGSYRLEALIGRGGMGKVYLAIHPHIGSRVAIKVVTDKAASDPRMVARFINEARAINLINHDHIVKINDLLTLPDGRPALVMEFLRGASLDAVIKRQGPLPLGTLAQLMGEVLEALAEAHEHGVIHRDLKPANVFVTNQGRAKLLDFGIAKLNADVSPRVVVTATGTILGSVPYMAPEQVRGEDIDGRSDLFSLSLVIYEAATGQRPYRGRSPLGVAKEHLDCPPRPPRELRPDMTEAFEDVLLRGMNPDPALRWQTAADMADALAKAARWLPLEEWEGLESAPVVGHGTPTVAHDGDCEVGLTESDSAVTSAEGVDKPVRTLRY